MLTKTLAATAALSLLVAGGEVLAAQKTSSAMAGPKQPIPYDQLNAYSKASAKTRASKDWWAGQAATGQATTGMSADTAATAPATASDPTSAPMTDTAVNPAPDAAPPSLPVTPPTNAVPQTGDPTLPNQPVPGAPGVPPTEPK